MLRVVVESAEVSEKSGTSPKTGKPYRIREQGAYIFLLGADAKEKKFPTHMRINLDDDQAPFPPGEYSLAMTSLYVGRFDALRVGRVDLTPRNVAAQRVA